MDNRRTEALYLLAPGALTPAPIKEHSILKQHLAIGLTALALAAALTGCTGSPGATTVPETSAAPTASAASASPTASTHTAATAADLTAASSSAGNIVVDAHGMSVYFYTQDEANSGASACTGSCLSMWPPVTTTSVTPTVEGVTGTLGTITTPDGAQQLTLNGLPLYHFSDDSNPGDVQGQGVGNEWYLATPAGDMIRTAG